MTIYILPENKDKFLKAVARASKHLTVAPNITVSGPVEKTQKTFTVWNDEDGQGGRLYKQTVTVLEVTIDDITSGDWVLVADVLFNENIVTLENSKYFCSIPAGLGLDYFRCDYCGHTHKNRTKAHIVYNTVTGKWMQIGTSCGKKMFNEGDICAFTVKLYEVIDISCGCMEEDFGEWCKRIPDHYWKKAWSVQDVMARVVEYRKTVSPEWEKAERTNFGEYIGGTANGLLDIVNAPELPANYFESVKGFVSGLADDTKTEYDPYTGTPYICDGFNTKIKRAFENGFILKADFYTVFFSVKMYEESLTAEDWEKRVACYKVGEKCSFSGLTLVSREKYEDIYGSGYFVKFATADGIIITKSFSNWTGFEYQFKDKDGKYSFKARVDYINTKKRTVKLGGRVGRI